MLIGSKRGFKLKYRFKCFSLTLLIAATNSLAQPGQTVAVEGFEPVTTKQRCGFGPLVNNFASFPESFEWRKVLI